jgi:hypothetical protein
MRSFHALRVRTHHMLPNMNTELGLYFTLVLCILELQKKIKWSDNRPTVGLTYRHKPTFSFSLLSDDLSAYRG